MPKTSETKISICTGSLCQGKFIYSLKFLGKAIDETHSPWICVEYGLARSLSESKGFSLTNLLINR